MAHAMAGGPEAALLGLHARPEAAAAVRAQLGLDRPLWLQFASWWWRLLHGDLGTSYLSSRSVAGMIAAYAGQTLALYSLGTVLAAILAIGTGLLHGLFYRGWPGRLFSAAELALYALPGFFIATLLCLAFATWLHLLPATGVADLRLATPSLADRLRHIALPALSIMLLAAPLLAMVFAQAVDTELARDYVRTARARGLGTAAILWRHVARNALRPLVTTLATMLPAIFSGSVMVETVFDYPGLGWLLWRSALAQDYPVLLGIVLVVGIATMLGNLAADLLNGLLDPRARYA